jgi:hypothetical protein
LIALIATLAMAPELAIGLTVTDNFRFNLVWPQQFVELFRSGHLYPRWLPHSWDGMGSPVFYFYPPLFFWVASIVDTVTAGTLGSERLVPLASLVLLIASGLSMRAWLGSRANEQHATVGAIAYVLAPYHLYDLYGRGALAEASAYASVPLVMLALARLADGRGRFIPVLVTGYATLLFSHLPTALLVTLFLVAPYAALLGTRAANPGRFVTRAVGGGLIGIAVSAVFVVPALALLPHVSPDALSGNFYRPENWYFWHVHAGIMSGRMLLIIPISIAAFLFAAAAAITVRTETSHREPLFWAGLTIFLVMLVAGLIPILWQLPGLRLVQFPWRALLLIEFTTITLLVVRAPSLRNPFALAGGAVLAFAYVALALIANHMVGRTWLGQQRAAAEIRADYQDAPEYLPAGTRIDQGEGPDDVRVVLPRLPLAAAVDAQAKIEAAEAADGGMTVSVDSPKPARLILRRFYFPHWQLHDTAGRPLFIRADPRHKVVTFWAPAGRSVFRLDVGTAPCEAVGRTLSLIGLLVLAVITAGSALRPRWKSGSQSKESAEKLTLSARS